MGFFSSLEANRIILQKELGVLFINGTSTGWIENADLDTFVDTGFYMIGNAPQHAPIGYCQLFVIGANELPTQIIFGHTGGCEAFYRNYKYEQGWLEWRQL